MDKPESESRRIYWEDANGVDVEAGRRPGITLAPDVSAPVSRPPMSRGVSRGSMSIASIREGRNSLSAAAAELPIQYHLAELDWHTLGTQEILKRLESSLSTGLASDDIPRRISKYGANSHSPPPSHKFSRIFGYFFGGFGPVLIVAGILVFIAWKPLGKPPQIANLALAIVLLGVFFIQAMFNLWQDWSSSKVMNSIKTMMPSTCLVIRNGQQTSIDAVDIVPGDIIVIKAGDKLCADVRYLEVSSDAKFDRSILTGESAPVNATIDSTDNNYLETLCIGLQGTHCAAGTCKGLVVSTGDSTVFGRIAKLASAPKEGRSTLETEVFNFVTLICSAMAAWLRKDHHNWINVPELIVSLVSIAVSFIPEGLPVAVTASMTISANMMRQNKILCKSLKTVETLGSVTVICSDKTGTLTQNKMTVTECATGTATMSADDAIKKAAEIEGNNQDNAAIAQLQALASLCNAGQFDASTVSSPLAERIIHGDATDQAILRFAEGMGSVADMRKHWTMRYDLAFNSKNKYMIRAFSIANRAGMSALSLDVAGTWQPDDILVTIKGAPDVLMPRLSKYVNAAGAICTLDDAAKAKVEEIKNAWSAKGRRVLLLARKAVNGATLPMPTTSTAFETEIQKTAASGLTLVGLVGIVDPPRPEIPEVVATLRGAGIRLFMVTGDFALTAQAIAAECGIITTSIVDTAASLSREPIGTVETDDEDQEKKNPTYGRALVLSGPELMTLTDPQWDRLAQYQEIVFARTTPEQKLRIVRELQTRGNVVGMTGDGVNDAPSLRAADVGIAMGSGSDIAMEAADMVLLDTFSSVVEALRFGRMMFDNLKKTVAYLMPAGCFSEFWPVMTNLLLGMPQILSSFLMIMICLFTDAAAAIALAYEAPEADVLLRKPRVPGKDRLVDWKLLLQEYLTVGLYMTTLAFTMSYWYLQSHGIPFSTIWLSFGDLPGIDMHYYKKQLDVASSIYFVTLVVMQWFHLMALRTRRLSIFQHPPLFNKNTSNIYLFYAIGFAIVMIFFWLYIPAFQHSLGTAQVPVEHWFLPMAFGVGLMILDEARKWAVRTYPKGFWAKIAW
ncbi:hypothetical protein TD95_000856 [Thielaviopsis punctulata]|uniref:Cation-transporting P-type ATPase N-terminal domain-containing protein n=1 Tax=Thielaviopsis punctulata TaxID=72032 RepID=A0A0F4ZJB6_9PEZI|nr:hypothetical protein TD95_000856 [Thielaviopsis punctulata]